jgi:hypothetical protein
LGLSFSNSEIDGDALLAWTLSAAIWCLSLRFSFTPDPQHNGSQNDDFLLGHASDLGAVHRHCQTNRSPALIWSSNGPMRWKTGVVDSVMTP